MATNVHELWRTLGWRKRRSPRRTPSPRRIGDVESLEARMLLNADVPGFPHAALAPSHVAWNASGAAEYSSDRPDSTISPIYDPIVNTEWGEAASETAWIWDEGMVQFTSSTFRRISTPPVRLMIRDVGFVAIDESGTTHTSTPSLPSNYYYSEPTWVYEGGVWNTLPVESWFTGPDGDNHEEPSTTSAPAAPTSTGPPTPHELNALPKVPWAPTYRHRGVFQDGNTSEDLRIPVGPATRSLTISVFAGDEAGDLPAPQVAEIYLTGPRGEILATLANGDFAISESRHKIVLEFHGAILGSSVLVRLSRADAHSPGPPGGPGDGCQDSWNDGGPSSPKDDSTNWRDPSYIVDITRGDARPRGGGWNSPAGAATSSNALMMMAPLPLLINDRIETSLSPNLVATTFSSDFLSLGWTSESTRTSVATSELEVEDDLTAEVFLGPLVSRTGAPLGPQLATEAEDPAPSSNRDEHLAVHAMRGDGDLELFLERERQAERQNDGGPSWDAPSSRMESIVKGPSGVPIVVSNLEASDPRVEALALAANLQRRAKERAALDESIETAILGNVDETSSPQPEIARAGFATRTIGFLIGMGLATGPLYPDLVAFARKTFRRKAKQARRRRPGGRG